MNTEANGFNFFQIPEGIGTELNQDLIQQLGPGLKISIYEGKPGKSYRFIFLYQDNFYAPT